MSEEKTMQDEMNEEWTQLAIQNMHKLIPQEWMPRINEITPQILNIFKTMIKKNIKVSADMLGNNKLCILVNVPYVLKDGSTIMVPAFMKIDKRQVGPSKYDAQRDIYDFQLRPGEQPEAFISLMTVIEKIDSYKKIEDMITDIKNGKLLSLQDFNYKEYNESENNTQKQLPESK